MYTDAYIMGLGYGLILGGLLSGLFFEVQSRFSKEHKRLLDIERRYHEITRKGAKHNED